MSNSIQFIGTQRSGSNLLRLILNQHDLISAPHPPHLLKTFVPLMSHYQEAYGSDLSVLADHMCQWVEVNPVPWTDVVLDRERITNSASSVYDIHEQIYLQKAEADKAEIWCCKSTFNVQYVDQLEKRIKPFYIHLYRDGRDVAASFKKIVIGQKHAYHLAKQWQDDQSVSLKFLERIEEERKIHISYESLLDRPDEIVSNICSKLSIEYGSNMLRYYNSEESQHTAESGKMWEAVIKPIMKNNKGKFNDELTAEEIEIFETVAGDTLDNLGYPRVYSNRNSVVLDIEKYDLLNTEMMKEGRQNAPSQELQRRMKQENLLEEIKRQLKII